MDQERFDWITRTLATGQSRRGMLRGLAGGLLAEAGSLMVERSALADHQPDHCAQAGEKEHLDQNHPKSCCPGLEPDASGRCQPIAAQVCPNAVLAAATGLIYGVRVDDDLEVFVNGVSVFVDNNENATTLDPIELGSLANGAEVRIVASDSELYCPGHETLTNMALYCPSTGTSQVLLAHDINQSSAACGEVFYDQSFTVAL